MKEGKIIGYYIELCEGNFIEVFENRSKGEGESQIKHFRIEIESIDEVSAILSANIIDVTKKKLGCDKSWQVWTEDPNGIRIEFHGYTKESIQITGGQCEVDW